METGWFKIIAAAFGGVFFSWFGTVWELAFFAFGFMALDYITGLLAGRANEGLSSPRAAKGLYKKFGFLLLLCTGFFLDGAFNHYIARGFSFQMPFELPIGLMVSVWIVITEAISICENVERLGVPIPPWLLKVLRRTHETISKERDSGKDGK